MDKQTAFRFILTYAALRASVAGESWYVLEIDGAPIASPFVLQTTQDFIRVTPAGEITVAESTKRYEAGNVDQFFAPSSSST